MSHHDAVEQPESPKSAWVGELADGPPSKKDLAALVESDGADDPVEVEYYEAAADPQFVLNETEQRRFRSQFRRRLRHLAAQARRKTGSPS
ncbi:hypothetical protein [Knoellia sp. LjRoot47]|uniref:hypothetical protein n=1 Tax=Knoellia sp. LjRoot47 TaxID=3342330 RepID=UPI003ECFEFE8